MEILYLSQRDIRSLLEKLDGVRNGQTSACTIIKNDTLHPTFAQTLRRASVVAVEDLDRYMPGVSPRLLLSRTSLQMLLDALTSATSSRIQIDNIEIFVIPDEQYYAHRGAADSSPVGDLASAFIRNRGK